MGKKSHKKYLKKRYKFIIKSNTLWDILDNKSRENLLAIKSRIIKQDNKKKNDYTNNTI